MTWRTMDRAAADRAARRQAVQVVAARQAVVALALPAGIVQPAEAVQQRAVVVARRQAVEAAARAVAEHRATLVLMAAVRLAGPEGATQQATGPAPAEPAARILAGHQAGVLAATHAKVVKPAGIGADRIRAAVEPEMLAAKTVLMDLPIVEAHRPRCGTQAPRARLGPAQARAM